MGDLISIPLPSEGTVKFSHSNWPAAHVELGSDFLNPQQVLSTFKTSNPFKVLRGKIDLVGLISHVGTFKSCGLLRI